MDIYSILKGVDCKCGKHHTCDIEHAIVENGAISHLSHICEKYGKILIVADKNTYRVAGKQVESALSGHEIVKAVYENDGIIIPNEEAIEFVQSALSDCTLIVGIGSGVIQDICKYVSFFSHVPYVIVATAPSMDGYASSVAAMILRGMKETVSAGLPLGIVADVSVLKDAPMEMIQSGYGDVLGKYSALNDWRLSNVVNGEPVCEYIYGITADMVEATRRTAKGLLARDEESIKTLTEALIVVGIMMSFAGCSRPASGSEHHLSHFFEITGILDNEPYLAHGLDVAYSTVIVARVREELLDTSFPDKIYREEKSDYERKIGEIYTKIAPECIALQNKMGNYAKNRLPIYKEKEQTIREILASMPSSKEIEEMLNDVGLDMAEFYRVYSEKKIANAVKYAKDLKDRYTVLWLNYDVNGDK